MTRATLFRVILAMRMLPNFTAYWWLLPKRMKFYHSRSAWLRIRMFRLAIQHYNTSALKTLERRFAFAPSCAGPISDKFYRIPIRRFR